jgi:hypothetical protein
MVPFTDQQKENGADLKSPGGGENFGGVLK